MERCIKEIVEDILLQINAEIESVELDNEIELDDALRIIKAEFNLQMQQNSD